jgi:hypothetical protein
MQLRINLSLISSLIVLVVSPAFIFAEELTLDHVVVSYTGISKAYADAIGRTVSGARVAAVEQFGLDMPDKINVDIKVDANEQVRLFNDGADRIFLTIRSEENLLKPGRSGIFNIYGMCHEVGHIAMYRLITDHSWLKSEGAEGWAHYMGSRLIDIIYAKEGGDLWPDRYDYSEDGMKRLEKDLTAEKPSSLAKGADAWKKLDGIVGDKKIATIIRAWGKAKIDPADPEKGLEKPLLANASEQTQQWWDDSKDVLVLVRAKSNVTAEKVDEKQLAAKTHQLIQDDGKEVGKKSIAGGGHAVRFQTPNDSSYLTEVRIYGSRYGQAAPPKENFHVWLCDKDFKVILDNEVPYSKIHKGNPRWVALKIKPTRVPQEFIICVGFNPTASKGVFLHYDAESSGNSLVGLPGEQAEPFEQGDWLIRATVTDKGDAK